MDIKAIRVIIEIILIVIDTHAFTGVVLI